MKIYVGYIMGDYAHAIFMSAKKEKVEKALKECNTDRTKWIEKYDVDNNNLIELDCD